MDKTTQGLKLLAEYMGEMSVLEKLIDGWHPDYKPYNTSWDALVPVYAKVCEYMDKKPFVWYTGVIIIERQYLKANRENNPQAAFEAVVELVNLINKENGK